jgi:predicted signal transduction protein with EAL and GGDEF domain
MIDLKCNASQLGKDRLHLGGGDKDDDNLRVAEETVEDGKGLAGGHLVESVPHRLTCVVETALDEKRLDRDPTAIIAPVHPAFIPCPSPR